LRRGRRSRQEDGLLSAKDPCYPPKRFLAGSRDGGDENEKKVSLGDVKDKR